MNNIKKIGVILFLIVLISSFSFAQELKPGKLFINNVEIPYTSKTDLEIYLYPRLNGINNDFMIYTKSKDEPINQKIFAFVYDNNQNKIKTMELFNDGRTVGYGNFFKMDNIGTFTVKLCIGSSEESCNELLESVTFEVGDFNCKSLFEEHNNINADRINMILLGHGYENEEILKKLSQKILTFDGNPILTNMYDKKTNEFVDKQLRWGLFSIEPFKSNKNKFNIWYSLIEEPVQDFLEKIKDGEGGYNLCGLKYPYIAVLDQEVFGMIADYPNFYDSPKINKEDISFGISFNSYDVISDSDLHSSGRFVYYEEVGEQINDIITYTTFSLLPHETGHALIGLTDEYETRGFRHAYPHCAKDINEAKEWWGDLIGQIDPFYYDYIRIMKENRVNISRGYSEKELGNYLTVGYYLGGCGIGYGNSGAVRPTYTSMMDDAAIPIFGSVNSARIEQVLNLFSGEETPPKEPKQISYIYANGQRIAKVENNEVFYYHNDHLGSPVAITNSKGDVVWQGDYKPFGESFNEVSFDGGNNIKYNSKELDKDTELNYYGARYYSAPTGRFITADTIKGSLTDPQSLNLYVYVKNNPLKYIDLLGLQFKYSQETMNVYEKYQKTEEGSEEWKKSWREFSKAASDEWYNYFFDTLSPLFKKGGIGAEEINEIYSATLLPGLYKTLGFMETGTLEYTTESGEVVREHKIISGEPSKMARTPDEYIAGALVHEYSHIQDAMHNSEMTLAEREWKAFGVGGKFLMDIGGLDVESAKKELKEFETSNVVPGGNTFSYLAYTQERGKFMEVLSKYPLYKENMNKRLTEK